MDHDQLRRLVAEELARALAAEAPRATGPTAGAPLALVIFSGALAPGEALLARFRSLRREGWNVEAAASHTFRSRVQLAHAQALGDLALVPHADDEAAMARAVDLARALVFPDLSDNALNKAGLGIADSLPSRALAQALVSGRPCLLLESWIPASPVVGLARLESLRRLERRGAVLADLESFAERLRSALAPQVPVPFTPLSGRPSGGGQPAARPVVTGDDVIAAAHRGQSRLRLPPRAIVTDRAREEAARRGVTLIADEAAS